MHKIIRFSSPLPSIPTVSDGKTCKFRDNLKIDQFFGSDGTLKSTGFPASDVTLLERLQRAGGTPYETLKAHINPVQGSSSDNRPASEIMDTLRPAWCQTAAENLQYEESVARYMENKISESPVESPAESSVEFPAENTAAN